LLSADHATGQYPRRAFFSPAVSKDEIGMTGWNTSRIAILVVACMALAFCARPKTIATPAASIQPPATRDIEALIERGCFRCLTRALELANERRLQQLAFEAATLLTLRANELGMPKQEWLNQARVLAENDPTRTLYLEMVAVVPPDPLSGQRDDLLLETQARNRAQSLLPVWREALHTGAGSLALRQYLELTLVCQVDTSRERVGEIDKLVAAVPDVPLLRYRAGICNGRFTRDNIASLTAVQSADAEFVDADYPMGRLLLENTESANQEEALRRFQLAAAAFPTSVSIALSIGYLYQTWEEWASALAAFDSTLALMPTHPDAQLGRTISLSQLARHQDAIDAATKLIDGGRWHLGQAFYWRAWNHYNLDENDLARADADRTRTLMVNSAVFLLSGLIEWKAPRLPAAEKEFEQSMVMDLGQCLAALYLGGVRTELSKAVEAIAAFQQARQCYDLSIAVHRAAIEKINSGSGTPAGKARGVAREERLIADAERRREQAIKTSEAVKQRLKLQTTAQPSR
jgi:tetratricopeptide (TPR) repeat protein